MNRTTSAPRKRVKSGPPCADTGRGRHVVEGMSAYAHGQECRDVNDQTAMPVTADPAVSTGEGKVKSASEARPRPARKGKAKSASEASTKRSLNLSLTNETYERLVIHAMRMTGGNISDLVTLLADTHLREYHLTRTASR